jgi:hypothetical protein
MGCATTQSIGVSERTRTYKASYDSTMKACVTYCEVRGFPLASVNDKVGLISTDYRENDGTSKFFFGNARAKVTFNLHQVDALSTKVVTTIVAEKESGNLFFRSYSAATMTEGQGIDLYKKVLDGIQTSLSYGNDQDLILRHLQEEESASKTDSPSHLSH